MEWTETISKKKYEIDTGSKIGEVSVICPICSPDRKKSHQRCLSLNTEKQTGYCQHCEKSFYVAKVPLNGKKHAAAPTIKQSFNIAPRALNDAELAYWHQYGISSKNLETYCVHGVDSYHLNGHHETTESDNPIFAYHAGGDSYKIYRPYSKSGQFKFCWINNKPEGWYFGLKYCKGSSRVYIAAGEKDVLSIVSQGGEAFTLNSETAVMPGDLAKKLKAQYKEVVVLYDSDSTGTKNSIKLCQEHGFIRATLPKDFKDVSDLIKGSGSLDDLTFVEVPGDDFFICKPASLWIEEAKQTDPLPQLFGPFITKGELSILFADPSAGKSVLAAQLGDNLCRGMQTMGLKNESNPMTTLYIDFELSAKQWQRRNSDDQGSTYEYHHNFLRAELNGLADFDDSKLEDVIFDKIERLADRNKAEIIIIDNISWLHSEADKAKFAVPLMRKLKGMVKDQGLTVIVINHTVKRDESRAITANDMAGSKQLRALADMIFTIGKSAVNKDVRYMKMLKDNRTTGELYGEDNVLVCELRKTDHLYFNYLSEGREADYLPRLENREHHSKDDQKVAAKVLSASGMTNVEIGKMLKVTEGTVRNWLK